MKKIKVYSDYCLTILWLLVLSIAMLFLVGAVSESYTDRIDEQYRIRCQSENFVVPSTLGNAMGRDYVYALEIPEGDKMIIFGSSTSILGVNEVDGYNLLKACSGSASINSYWVMVHYLLDEGLEITAEDIVKIDISPVTFRKTALSNEVLVSALTYGDLYEVDQSLNVQRSSGFILKKMILVETRKIQKAYEYLETKVTTSSYDALFTPAVNDYSKYHKLISIDEEKTALVEELISTFKDNAIVDIMYMSDELYNSEAGAIFNQYVDQTLIPYLIENEIPYIDSRLAVENELYVDNTHLNAQGREVYTEFVNDKMKEILK